MTHQLLLVEDDSTIQEMVEQYLREEGYEVTSVCDGVAALTAYHKQAFQLIILDIMMPKLNGIDVLKRIREYSDVPILMMSAKDKDIDKVIGLELGADDYIAKPFSMIELSARVKALIRRSLAYTQANEKEASIAIGDLIIDLHNYEVLKQGEAVMLTQKEFAILKLFAQKPNRVFTKAQIYQHVWADDYYGDENVINVHMRRLREKIEDDPSHPQYIKTLWGIGYKLEKGSRSE